MRELFFLTSLKIRSLLMKTVLLCQGDNNHATMLERIVESGVPGLLFTKWGNVGVQVEGSWYSRDVVLRIKRV